MRFCFAELLLALSTALDCVESDLIGDSTCHSKRVAYLCIGMGKKFGLGDQALSDLAAYALLHDNAITEYMQSEHFQQGGAREAHKRIGLHCAFGERNVAKFPFFNQQKQVILYHHENANGSGPFGKTDTEIPFFAALIHLADRLDAIFALQNITPSKYEKIKNFLAENKDSWFRQCDIDLFMAAFPDIDSLLVISNDKIDDTLKKSLVYFSAEYSPRQLRDLAEIFARIIDYKSTFTSLHSMGIADKAGKMAEYYGGDDELCAKLFLAGAFHDIGKLTVDVGILEKTGSLTAFEFEEIKKHALKSWEILSSVSGFEDIARWAAFHHEKLDGSGYPFGYTAEELGHYERLMCCLDIYQALREERPYKKAKNHVATIAIMQRMAQYGSIDEQIVQDIDKVFGET